jgi:hypothetical protein
MKYARCVGDRDFSHNPRDVQTRNMKDSAALDKAKDRDHTMSKNNVELPMTW